MNDQRASCFCLGPAVGLTWTGALVCDDHAGTPGSAYRVAAQLQLFPVPGQWPEDMAAWRASFAGVA